VKKVALIKLLLGADKVVEMETLLRTIGLRLSEVVTMTPEQLKDTLDKAGLSAPNGQAWEGRIVPVNTEQESDGLDNAIEALGGSLDDSRLLGIVPPKKPTEENPRVPTKKKGDTAQCRQEPESRGSTTQ
jgi:hypothetical protein